MINSTSLKQTIRNLLSSKTYFVINLLGLISGIVAFVLLMIVIKTETSFDKFHQHSENIYRIDYKLYEEEVLELHSASAVASVGKEMKQEFPEVLDYTRFSRFEAVVSFEDINFKESDILYADSSFFNIFSFQSCVRIDMIIRDNIPGILEINTSPGMTETSDIPAMLEQAKIAMIDFLTANIENVKK